MLLIDPTKDKLQFYQQNINLCYIHTSESLSYKPLSFSPSYPPNITAEDPHSVQTSDPSDSPSGELSSLPSTIPSDMPLEEPISVETYDPTDATCDDNTNMTSTFPSEIILE